MTFGTFLNIDNEMGEGRRYGIGGRRSVKKVTFLGHPALYVLLNSIIDIEIQILMRRNLSHFCVAGAHGEIWNPNEHGQKSLKIVFSLQIVPILNSLARSSFEKKRCAQLRGTLI